MEQPLQHTFRNLIEIAGKILFVTGLVMGILSLFSGFWPGLVFFLVLLAGAGLIAISRDTGSTYRYDTATIRNMMDSVSEFIQQTDYRWLYRVIRSIALGITIVFVLAIAVLVIRQNFFKKSNTINDCREITAALDYYKDYKNVYPSGLPVLIGNNPLRNDWYKDGWNKPYRYSTDNNGSTYTLISAGPDRKFYTNDDIIFHSK